MIYTPKNKQSILDVVLQHHGNLDSIFQVMNQNGITDLLPDMTEGVELVFNQRSKATQFYLQNQFFPSTLPDFETPVVPPGSFSLSFTNSFN